jgi:hypothetical protein
MDHNDKKANTQKGNLLLFITVTVICLIIAETALRVFKPLYFCMPIEAYQYDKELGYRVRPGIHLFNLTDYEQETRTNKIGTLNFQENFSEYKKIIFTLGDSYTQGIGVPPDASYPFQLNLDLNIDRNGIYTKNYGVVNLALGPYGAEQELLTLKRFAKKIRKPDIVLYLGCDNDYSDDTLFKNGTRHKNIVQGSPYYGGFYYPLKWIFMDTEIGKRLKYSFQEILKGRTAQKPTGKGKKYSTAELEAGAIKRIVETGREYDAVVILSWAYAGDSYYWLKSWAAQHKVLFADWEPSVKSVGSAIPQMPINNHHSGGHHRTWVNNLIAREFAKQINQLYAIPQDKQNRQP